MRNYKLTLIRWLISWSRGIIKAGLVKNVVRISLIFTVIITACDSDDIGDNYYTFTGETIGYFISNRPDTYSEFSKLLDTTGVKGLLNAYGKYTCFIPNNDAMFAFYKSKGRNSLNDFPQDSLKKIAYDHIIKDVVVSTEDFKIGFLQNITMSGRYLKIAFESGQGSVIYKVNESSTIVEKDVEAHNGVIHQLDVVLNPTENTVDEVIADTKEFSLFAEAMQATGLDIYVTPIKDDDYIPDPLLMEEDGYVAGHYIVSRVPKERKYGFTVLVETNAVFAENGINNLDDLKTYASQVYDAVYPQDANITDVTNRKNSLNRFVAYHMINKKIPAQFFIEKWDNTGKNYAITGETHSVKTYDMFEYITTMCPNTLMEVRTDRNTSEYNIFNRVASGHEVRLTENFDIDAINGVVHEIDDILAYTTDVAGMLSSKRLRMDAASFFPELMNNHMRVGAANSIYSSELWLTPAEYIDAVEVSETTQFGYINADDRFLDYQGDEVWLSGLYDFHITTPPVPAGTYEVRFGYQPTIFRGAAQLYWDGKPCGIPLDLRLDADNPKIGYVQPGTDLSDPLGYENDKMMRNRGYMKAPASFKVINPVWYSGTGRMSNRAVRKILGIFTFNEDGTHIFSVKAARGGEFMFDYLEFVPLEIIENEGVD